MDLNPWGEEKNTAARLPLRKKKEKKRERRQAATANPLTHDKLLTTTSLFSTFYIQMAAHFKGEIPYCRERSREPCATY
jgi:hypothetical protein